MWICIFHQQQARERGFLMFTHILREASALFARLTKMGNTRASVCRTSNKYGSHAFLLNKLPISEPLGVINIVEIYKKSFVFEASSFEEYLEGRCVNNGLCNTAVIAKVLNDECIGMMLQRDVPVRINTRFGFPIFGLHYGDVLEDRVQYGRIPDSFCWQDSNEPVVCNIFNNMSCIRFAMMSPLRIVEFNGKFTDISNL